MSTNRFVSPVRVMVGCAAVVLAICAGRVAFAGGCCPGGGDKEKPSKGDAAVIAEQLPGYPLDTCVVSGEKLGGEMGEPFNHVYQGRLVRFCCKGCVKEFGKDPAKYLAKIDAAKGGKDKGHEGHDGKHKGGCCP